MSGKLSASPGPAAKSDDPAALQQLLDTANLALDHAGKMGASSAEISIEQGQGMSITVREGKVETVERNRDKGFSLTVYFDHRSGSSASSDFTPQAIRDSVQAACNIAKFTEEDPCNGLAERNLLARTFPDLDLYHPWELGVETAIDLAKECEQAALSSDMRISNTEGATISSHDGVSLYANTQDFLGVSRGSRHAVSCSVLVGKADAMQRDYWYDSNRNAKLLQSVSDVGRETARRALRRLGARKIPTGRHPVIYEPQVASSLVSHLISAISGAGLYRKSSFLAERLGEQIFPACIRLFEQPHLPGAIGSAVFDSEGVATCQNVIIDSGRLSSYVLDSYTARKLGMQTTGNAGGVHNMTLNSTVEKDLSAFIRDLEKGVVVSELIGYGVNIVTGDYSRGACGFWVENGEIQYPVEEFTIAGNLNEMFRNISAVGADTDIRRNVRTGSIVVDNMTVAGQ